MCDHRSEEATVTDSGLTGKCRGVETKLFDSCLISEKSAVPFAPSANLTDHYRCIDCVTFALYMRFQFSNDAASQPPAHQNG